MSNVLEMNGAVFSRAMSHTFAHGISRNGTGATTGAKCSGMSDLDGGAAGRCVESDLCHLLREQREFLNSAQPSEIRALLFLRFRLSAQQKRTMQCNQLAERRAAQSRCRSATPLIVAQISPVARSPDGHRPPQRPGSSESVAPPAETVTARGFSCAAHPPAETPPRRMGTESSAGVAFVMSIGTESLSTLNSPLMAVSSPQEERRNDRLERSDMKESPGRCLSMSREGSMTLSNSVWQQKMPSILRNCLDDIPASVEARLSCEKELSVPDWISTTPAAKTRENSVNMGDKDPRIFPGSLGVFSHTNASFSASNVLEEGERATEPIKPCPHCGRRFFAVSRWPRHVAVCEQQRQQAARGRLSGSRKLLNTPGKEVTHLCAEKKRKGADAVCVAPESFSTIPENPAKPVRTEAEKKDAEWRKQSLQAGNSLPLNGCHVQSMGAGKRKLNDHPHEDDRVCCPTCGRRFSRLIAKRHISSCKALNGAAR